MRSLLFILLLLPSPAFSQLDANQMLDLGYRRYGVESGIIEYKLTGNTTGTWTVYFDKWGWREARYEHTTTSFGGMKSSSENLAYIDGEWLYNVDMNTKQGTAFTNPMMKGLPDYMETHKLGLAAQMLYERGAAEQRGNETVLGHTCQVWYISALGTTASVWKDTAIVLKEDGNFMGSKVTRIATSVQINVPIPADKIRLPADAKILKSPTPGTKPSKEEVPRSVVEECEELLKLSRKWAASFEATRKRCDGLEIQIESLNAKRGEAGARRDEARAKTESAKAKEASLQQAADNLKNWLNTLQPAGMIYDSKESIPPGMQYVGSGGVYIAFTNAQALEAKIQSFPGMNGHSFGSVFQSYGAYGEKIREQQAIQKEESEKATAANQESKRLGGEIDLLKAELEACEAEEEALEAKREEIKERDELCKTKIREQEIAKQEREDYERLLKEYRELSDLASSLKKEAYEAIQTHHGTEPELEQYNQASKLWPEANDLVTQAGIQVVAGDQLMRAEQFREAHGKFAQANTSLHSAINKLKTHNNAMSEIIRSANAKPLDLCENFQAPPPLIERYYAITEIKDIKLAVDPYTPESFESMKAKATAVLDGLNWVNQIQMAGMGIQAGSIMGTEYLVQKTAGGAMNALGKVLAMVGEKLPEMAYDQATSGWSDVAFEKFLDLLMSNKPRKIFFYATCTEYEMTIKTVCEKKDTGDETHQVAEPNPLSQKTYEKVYSFELDPGFKIPSANPQNRGAVTQQLVGEAIQRFNRDYMGKFHKVN